MFQKISIGVGVLCFVIGGLWVTTEAATADESGEWQCFIGDKFPDIKAAADWRGAQKVSEGLNQVAKHVQRGEIITVPYPIKAGMGSQVAAPLVCVKN